jgi:hypothetical protein
MNDQKPNTRSQIPSVVNAVAGAAEAASALAFGIWILEIA